ncbi:hypothetical protein XBFFL1_2580004 [Xenorhabdus bovienii str. feltiae Florida]|nr:hypothetical protein XBFFR1_1220003 [Xenorhabdus bovienii str. feltiae France]CDG93629.1 hypothetical protein XBFFL1_2580004 [Xenorhabdus bovienii str. feltiae Florida]
MFTSLITVLHLICECKDNNFSITTELYIDINISTGDIVSFDIVPNEHAIGFSTKTINYTAHEVDLEVIY